MVGSVSVSVNSNLHQLHQSMATFGNESQKMTGMADLLEAGKIRSVGVRKFRPAFFRRGMRCSKPVVDELRAVGDAHEATASQVALAWLLQLHGDTVVAIPGVTKAKHASDTRSKHTIVESLMSAIPRSRARVPTAG